MFKEVPSQFDFPAEEKRILKFWEKERIYEKSLAQRKGGPPFVFFEGPPTANGLPHPGHCLTRAIKDLFPRYKTMTGHYCLRKGGWDTHGLPVEVEVCKELGIHTKEEIETYGVEAFNRKCLESVFRYTKEWEEMTRRLGFWVNLDEAYVTYHQSYIESVWWSLKQLFDAGLLYQGHKIVWWWAQGGTALSAGEVGQGYREVDDPSVYVRFPLVRDDRFTALFGGSGPSRDLALQSRDREGAGSDAQRGNPLADARGSERVSLLVWTTTPWTLPSNMFAAVNKDFDYAIVLNEETGERLIFAAALVEQITKKAKQSEKWKIERTVKGLELVGLRYTPPFRECYYDCISFYEGTAFTRSGPNPNPEQRIWGDVVEDITNPQGSADYVGWRILQAPFVTLDSGTGLVHEAPAFGEVDFDLLQRERRRFSDPDFPPLFCAVAPNGSFKLEQQSEQPQVRQTFIHKYEGRWVKDCDKDIIRDMKEREAYPGSKIPILLHQETYRHDYPFCWRAEEDPLLQYPRKSWFIKTTQFKDAMLANNAKINWLPEHIKEGRFGKFLESNVDWSLSRERYWGTPLPIWVCDQCGHMEAVDSYAALIAKPGVGGLDTWHAARRQSPELSEHLKVHKPYIDAITYACPKCAAPSDSSEPSRDREGAGSGVQSENSLADARGSEASAPTNAREDGRPRMRRVPEVIDCWYDSGAMPFAQWGFPHKNLEMFKSQFPADFISEALDQTRGWFYSLVAIATMLFGERGAGQAASAGVAGARHEHRGCEVGGSSPWTYPIPFRDCIVLGLLMGEDGLKMSKSKKNYREPSYIFDHEGADAMRWLFFSGQTPWTSIRFQEEAIAEGQREFLIRLYHCYSFFVIYANIDGWAPDPVGDRAEPSRDRPEQGPDRQGGGSFEPHQNPLAHARGLENADAHGSERGELDGWILSELHRATRDVRAAMDAYDNYTAARALNGFVDALSNWYVRRSRDRFWKGGMDEDKRRAYAVLYDCLVTTAKLIAPFTPFFAESIYQNLVRSQDAAAPVSVHLCDYPTADPTRIDERLSKEMSIVRDVVSLGRAARAEAKVKTRQPLPLVEIVLADKADTAWLAEHEALVCDELNVKAVEFVAEADHYVDYRVKPNFKAIGPKFGHLAPAIKQALAAAADPARMRREIDGTGRTMLTVGGQSIELTVEDVQIELSAKPGWAAAQDRAAVVVLKTEITAELRAEGQARELVHQVQQTRKTLNLRYDQRIDLAIVGDEELRSVVIRFAPYIQGETLAQNLLSRPLARVEPVKFEIEGRAAEVYVQPL